jgi:LPXTG-motif cell wall-anchored protein
MSGSGFVLDDTLVNYFHSIAFDSNGVGWMIWDDETMGALYSFDAATGEITYAGLTSDEGTWKEIRSTFLMSPAPASLPTPEPLAKTGIDHATASTVAGFGLSFLVGAVLLRRRRSVNKT